jgi:HDOD domain-containing protein
MPHFLHRSVGNETHRQKTARSAPDNPGGSPKLAIHFASEGDHEPLVSPAAASRLTVLLQQAAIDLGEISDAIRACPEFELVVLRVSESLALSLGTRVATIEDAVVILGKDQLYALVQTWSGGRASQGSIPEARG